VCAGGPSGHRKVLDMSESFFSELRRYLGFGVEDEGALRDLHAHACPHFRRITDRFYARILEHEAAARVLRTPEQVERLKVTLESWLQELLRGPWDDHYYERRARIGRVHVKVGLPQRYMFTAMGVVQVELTDIAHRAFAVDPNQLSLVARAVVRVFDLELAIMLETYREDTMAQLARGEQMEREFIARRLEISEERYHAVVENAGLLVIATDLDGEVLLFNQTAEEATGLRRGELIGKPWLDILFHPRDRSLATKHEELARAGSSPPPFEARLLNTLGEERWIRWHFTPLPAPGVRQLCAIGLDITDTRGLEKRTRRAERLVSLGTLAAGLAHEIRNPLNAAKLQLALLERRLDRGANPVEPLALVRQELDRLAGLVQDFLSFARPTELRLLGADLRQTVTLVVDLLAPEAEERGVTLNAHVPADPVACRCDEERVKQVLLNLLRNGMDAAGQNGRVAVTVLRAGDSAVIEVSDSGAGLPEGIDIFEPFFTTKESGTGLGLPIVLRIVTDHGGEISVARTAEMTLFRVELPLDGPPARQATV
jgi:PAS domain S-box-containing protein